MCSLWCLSSVHNIYVLARVKLLAIIQACFCDVLISALTAELIPHSNKRFCFSIRNKHLGLNKIWPIFGVIQCVFVDDSSKTQVTGTCL